MHGALQKDFPNSFQPASGRFDNGFCARLCASLCARCCANMCKATSPIVYLFFCVWGVWKFLFGVQPRRLCRVFCRVLCKVLFRVLSKVGCSVKRCCARYYVAMQGARIRTAITMFGHGFVKWCWTGCCDKCCVCNWLAGCFATRVAVFWFLFFL